MKKIVKHSNIFLVFLCLLLSLSAYGEERVDPTRPPGYVESAKNTLGPGGLALTAVFIYENDRVAIINDQELKVGDTVGGYTVTIINGDSVELTDSQGRKETLELNVAVKQQIKGI